MKQFITKGIPSLFLLMFLILVCPDSAFAKNAGGIAAFDDLTWEKILDEKVQTSSGVVQSICATEDYIICLENSGDSSKENDIAYAYYKNPWDENGNPVEQYSLAFKNDKWDWEHCNGMCYNKDNDEIYVALYTNHSDESRGCIYVMDPHTLDYKYSIKVTDDYNILGIGYYPKKGIYMIQANSEGDYGIKILDGNFDIIADFGEADLGLGSNSQDMCVCGEYIINFPLTFDKEGQGSYMNVYSVDYGGADASDDYQVQFTMIGSYPMELGTDNLKKVEPESICEVEDGVFVCTVNVMNNKGKRRYAWYKMVLNDYYYEVKTSCKNGTITSSDSKIQPGTAEFKVTYTPDDGYELSSVLVDGNLIDINEYPSGYTFTDIREDHTIIVECTAAAAAITTESKGPSDTGRTEGLVAEKSPKEKTAAWKLILILLAVLAATGFGAKKYLDHVRIERRKKAIQSKLRRHKEREQIQKEMEMLEREPVEISLQEALQEINELESDAYKIQRRKR